MNCPVGVNRPRSVNFSEITSVENAVRRIGTLSAGILLSSMVIPGTVRCVESVEIGESGTASAATSARMESPFLASTVALQGHVEEGVDRK